MTRATSQPDLLARDLARLLTDLAGLHAEMIAHAREKLDAMRRADGECIAAITTRELLLAEKVAEREGLRRQITRKIVEALGMPRNRAETLRVGELAGLLPEPRAGALLAAAATLRQATEELQGVQRTVALVTHEMIKHLNEMIAVMCGGGLPAESYTRGGGRARPVTASVFEAVG